MRAEYTVVYEDGDDGWVIARALELPGAMTQGRTLSEARKNIVDAIGLLLQTYRSEALRAAAEGSRVESLPVEAPVIEAAGSAAAPAGSRL